jgi:Fe2+ or Zn2+ uptake regulation protein
MTKSKILFDKDNIHADLSLEEIVALCTSGQRTSQEYNLSLYILKELIDSKQLTKEQMYKLYHLKKDGVSKATFYRALKRLIDKGMVFIIEDKEKEVYKPSIYFSNALQKLAMAWEKIVLEK